MSHDHLVTKLWQNRGVSELRHSLSPRRIFRHATARRRRLPDFIIVGAQKAGTTSLFAYLCEHPQVEPPIVKETGFFDQRYHRGLGWYRLHFPWRTGATRHAAPTRHTLTGESTAHYMFHPLAARRIAQSVPEARIIMLLRNPIDRAYSHYQMKVRRRQEPLPFDQAIEAEEERLAGELDKLAADPDYYSEARSRYSYLARGRYLEQVRRFQAAIPAGQLLILESGQFFKHTADVFARVLAFLGLSAWQPPEFGNRFPGKYSEKMSDATRRKLVDYFAPFNEDLYAHLGQRFDWDR